MQTIKCISLWQPWASLCVIQHPHGLRGSVKKYETRSWPTRYRGPLLIHAARRYSKEQQNWCYEDFIFESLLPAYPPDEENPFSLPDRLPTGAIIGRVDLVDCMPCHIAAADLDEYAEAMGDYRFGRFAWEIIWPVMFKEPIPYRGQQGLFDVPVEIITEHVGVPNKPQGLTNSNAS